MAWFLLDAKHADYSGLIAGCSAAHQNNAPGCLLSIVENLDASRTLVKVAGVGRNWLQSAAVLDRADGSDHDRFVDLLTPSVSGAGVWCELDGGGPDALHSGALDGGEV